MPVVKQLHGDGELDGLTLDVNGVAQKIDVDGLFVAIGQQPDNAAFAPVALDTDGYIVADDRCRTNIRGVYAAGDCRAKTVRQLTTAAADGAIAVDTALNVDYIIDVGAEALCAGEKTFVYADGKEYTLDDGGEYAFTSGEIDFSTDGKKVLKEVVIDSENEVRVEVSNGVISRIVGGVRGKFRPNMRGKSFKITVCGSGKISKICAVAEVRSGV